MWPMFLLSFVTSGPVISITLRRTPEPSFKGPKECHVIITGCKFYGSLVITASISF